MAPSPAVTSALSTLPSISALLADARLADIPHAIAVRSARDAVDAARATLLGGGAIQEDLVPDVLLRVSQLRAPRLKGVINATGIVLHTNLGRAPLCSEAVAAIADVARGYANVELELETGQRGGRLRGISEPLCELTGAEAATAVNNNAAAVLLVLTALARGREVIVSRGELVEIGGSFRVPEVIASGGARLVEVGATNRTRVSDYARAITADTALLLRVHPSNFRMIGFAERANRAELAALAHARGIPLVEDLGSGLIGAPPDNLASADLAHEAVDAALGEGVDLVCFSGDKLLGGPQAGLIAGRADLVAAVQGHPLYRALRLDKLVLAALEATLQVYREGRSHTVPTRRLLSTSQAELALVARAWAAQLPGARVESDVGYSGGGALPGQGLPTSVVAVECADPDAVCAELRRREPPVVARVARGTLVLDPRTVLPGQGESLIQAVRAALAVAGSQR